MAEDIPQITTKHYGITDEDQPEVEINKLAVMVEGWMDERLADYTVDVDLKLKENRDSVQLVIDNFYSGILKYLRTGIIVSLNVGLIGFGWFLNNVLGN